VIVRTETITDTDTMRARKVDKTPVLL